MRDIIRKILREENQKQVRTFAKTINSILEQMRTEINDEDNPEGYGSEIIDHIDDIVKIEVTDVKTTEDRFIIHINTYTEGVTSYYGFEPIYSEIEWILKRQTRLKVRLKEDEIIHDKTGRNW
jgi:thymidylate synthase